MIEYGSCDELQTIVTTKEFNELMQQIGNKLGLSRVKIIEKSTNTIKELECSP